MTLVQRFEEAVADGKIPVIVIVADGEGGVEVTYAASYTLTPWSPLYHPSARQRNRTLCCVMAATLGQARKQLG